MFSYSFIHIIQLSISVMFIIEKGDLNYVNKKNITKHKIKKMYKPNMTDLQMLGNGFFYRFE